MTRSHTATTIAPTVRGSYHWYGDGWPALDSRSCSPSTRSPRKRFNGTAAPRMRSNVQPNS